MRFLTSLSMILKIGAPEIKRFLEGNLKLLTENLKTVMEKLVEVYQMGFLQGRQTMDAALLANELVDSRLK